MAAKMVARSGRDAGLRQTASTLGDPVIASARHRSAVVLVALAAVVLAAPARPASGSGLGIVSVRVVAPSGQRNGGVLTPARVNVVFAATEVTLAVTVHNAGGSPRTRVALRLVIRRGSGVSPIVATRTLGSVGPRQSQVATFARLGKVPLALQTSVAVALDGQSRVYPIVFVLRD